MLSLKVRRDAYSGAHIKFILTVIATFYHGRFIASAEFRQLQIKLDSQPKQSVRLYDTVGNFAIVIAKLPLNLRTLLGPYWWDLTGRPYWDTHQGI